MYRAIQPPELLNQNWSSANKRETAKNVVLMVERSNKVIILLFIFLSYIFWW